MPRTTLATIAAAAGVSTATVSKVLNARPDVGQETRARVERALADHGYVAQRRKQTRTRRRVRTVGLVCDDLLSPYTVEVLRGVSGAAAEANVDVVVALLEDVLGGLRSSSGAWVRRLRAAGHEGMIVVACELTELQGDALDRAGLPVVAIDALSLPSIEVATVGSTNGTGALAATQHLIGLGHERIAFVGGPETSSCSQARLHGYLAAMTTAGLPVDPALISHGPFITATGVEEGRRLLALAEPPTAVFAANDPIALGVAEAARLNGRGVPADLSVVGFDDTFLAESSTPPLTTVRQPLQQMGSFAFGTLMRLVGGQQPDTPHIELATELVIRDSTAPYRPSGVRKAGAR